MRVAEPSFDGHYRGRSHNHLHNLQWTDVWAAWSIRTSASLNRHSARRQLGNLDLTPSDLTGKIRTDWERVLGAFGILRLGTEVEHAGNRFVGSIPQGDILDPEAEVFELDASYSARRTGAWFEVDFKPVRRIAANAGMRADRHSLGRGLVVDPRLSAPVPVLARHERPARLGHLPPVSRPVRIQPHQRQPESGDPSAPNTGLAACTTNADGSWCGWRGTTNPTAIWCWMTPS